MSMERNENMNQAKLWQIAFFACNEIATNLYLYLMMYVSYYAVGIVGLGTVLVSNLVMGMRVFDGFTDPIVGYMVDKTNGRFGKNRPFLVIGNVILALSVIVMFQFTHRVPDMLKLPFFVLIYACYIIGYTFQCVVTKSAQSCLTNDPKQRPMFAMFAGTYNAILAAVIALLVSGTWVKQYGGFTQELFNTFMVFTVVSSMGFTALAVIGIWKKDRQEFSEPENRLKSGLEITGRCLRATGQSRCWFCPPPPTSWLSRCAATPQWLWLYMESCAAISRHSVRCPL